MDLGPYTGFILASYGITTLVILALVIWVWGDRRAQERALAQLAAQGYGRTRESAASGKTKAGATQGREA